MGRSLLFEIGVVALACLLAVVPLLLGAPPGWVWPLVPLALLVHHLVRLVRLVRLIRRRHRLIPPFPSGLWGEVYRSIAQYQQRGRKRRKRHLRFSRRFREAADAVPDALVILDKLQQIEWANPAAVQLLNLHWPRDDGRRLPDLLPHPDLAAFIEVGEYARPLDLTPEHNHALMLSLRIAPFGERKRERLVVARDITKVYHLNMIRRDFVANASHELRTPLTVIAGFLENLADAAATPPGHRRPLALMQHQAERMRSIIGDLLTLSRLEMDDQDAHQGLVDVADEVDMIIHESSVLSDGQHHFETAVDADLLLHGSPVELRSAFANLVHNAVRHTPAGSTIRIGWGTTEDGPQFSVEDDGEGIPAEHLPRLTERFYRVDQGRSRASGGTGLGLAIVKHVLNRHDARLSISSSVGTGSRFACQFPAARATARQETTSEAETV
ncbi:MAG TPA: phosphate regulon sensor histidine kinase PhoR [Lamprocystis sp. (in: g-proteobacteria)]|nr:phosphate regulon sensor histidine kinase PhoR [Lamprocystis sp. (in: g-proteobacteria)]